MEGGSSVTSSTSDDDPVGGGIIGEMVAQDALAREVLSHLPAGYDRIELEFSAVGPVAQASMWSTQSDGSENSVKDLSAIVAAARALRAAMYRENSGTWFSMKMTVTAERSMDVSYNYDELPWSNFDYSPDAYTADLEQFPRDDAHIPAWLRAQL
jgi:hypothetical protein